MPGWETSNKSRYQIESILNGYDWGMTLTVEPERGPDLDAHTLRIVGAIADTGSITAAAAQLGYSQPAVSQHLKRAEGRIGLPLVVRAGRSVRLTEAGRVLARHARTVTTALDAAAGELAELAGLRTGTVRVAAFPSASSTLVPLLLAELARRHPGVGVRYLEAEPPEAVQAVRTQEADLAITFAYPGDRGDPHTESARGLAVVPLWRDEMLLVAPAGRVAAGPVELADFAGERWIAGCPRCRQHLLQLCDSAGFGPAITHETDNVAAVLAMVAAGLGVALLPRLGLATAALPPGVAMAPTRNRDARTIHLVAGAGSDRVPAIAAAADAIISLDGAPFGLTDPR